MFTVAKIARVLFSPKKMVKKGYYGDEGLGLVWDRIKVRWMALFITSNGLLFLHHFTLILHHSILVRQNFEQPVR